MRYRPGDIATGAATTGVRSSRTTGPP